MKPILSILSVLLLLPTLFAYDLSQSAAPIETPTVLVDSSEGAVAEGGVKITLAIGNDRFSATLYDNASTRALTAQFPVTLTMDDLNGNEKFSYLADALPTNSERLKQIYAGDIMLYGDDCLVVFYAGLASGYSYTRLGSIDDAAGFAGVAGGDDVEITFALS